MPLRKVYFMQLTPTYYASCEQPIPIKHEYKSI